MLSLRAAAASAAASDQFRFRSSNTARLQDNCRYWMHIEWISFFSDVRRNLKLVRGTRAVLALEDSSDSHSKILYNLKFRLFV